MVYVYFYGELFKTRRKENKMLKDGIDFVVALVGQFVFIEREEEKNSIILRHSAPTIGHAAFFN